MKDWQNSKMIQSSCYVITFIGIHSFFKTLFIGTAPLGLLFLKFSGFLGYIVINLFLFLPGFFNFFSIIQPGSIILEKGVMMLQEVRKKKRQKSRD